MCTPTTLGVEMGTAALALFLLVGVLGVVTLSLGAVGGLAARPQCVHLAATTRRIGGRMTLVGLVGVVAVAGFYFLIGIFYSVFLD